MWTTVHAILLAPGEIGADGVFPHLYNGGRLGSREIDSIFTLEKSGHEWDTQIIAGADWLIY